MKVQTCVVGAGVVGLAVGRALARAGREVVIIEKEYAIGMVTSSRNSEVVHAGIYYPQGSLKARLCVEGRRLMYAYCESHGVAYKRCGKILVATDASQIPKLDEIESKAASNGVEGISRLSSDDIRALEPSVSSVGGILSDTTGVVDSYGLMLGYQGDAEDAGAFIAFNTPVIGGEASGNKVVLETGGDMPGRITCNVVINTGGLGALSLAERIVCREIVDLPKACFAKGNYYKLVGQSTPFQHLIYPVPAPNTTGLGVHATVDIGGQCRFGPDVEWVTDANQYAVAPERSPAFYGAVREYWPGLKDGALVPDYSGIRPKLSGPGEPAVDFHFLKPDEHGGPRGLYHLLGIESPGLTSSLALGELVCETVLRDHPY